MTTTAKRTWKPTVAGILDIVAGVFGLIAVILLFVGAGITGGILGIPGIEAIPRFVPYLLLGIAIPLAVLGILALVGGIYALQRKGWGWALAGSIAAVFASTPILRFLPIGIVAIIFTAISKDEFE